MPSLDKALISSDRDHCMIAAMILLLALLSGSAIIRYDAVPDVVHAFPCAISPATQREHSCYPWVSAVSSRQHAASLYT
jgi:hypothetical protein